jgi:NAD(P)-dependent dehydrogenase (short-subunit alcohol dehydrogenase family)
MLSIFITGTNRGIGLAFVREYLARGERVFAACRIPTAASNLQKLKKLHGDQLVLLPLDVTDPAAPQAAAQRIQQETPTLDVLINNAGVFFPSTSIADLRRESLTQSFAVNSVAPLLFSQQLLPLLQNSASPRIVNITTPARPLSQLQRTEHHSYVASRYALNALTKMMALELRSLGVLVVALWPGYLRTDMNNMDEAATLPEEALPQIVDLIHNLTWEQTGCCLLPDGKVFEW